MRFVAVLAGVLSIAAPDWTVAELEARVLEELRADGVELPARALDVAALQGGAWRVELRSDDRERRWRDLAQLPDDLEAAAATVRLVVLELMAPYVPSLASAPVSRCGPPAAPPAVGPGGEIS